MQGPPGSLSNPCLREKDWKTGRDVGEAKREIGEGEFLRMDD